MPKKMQTKLIPKTKRKEKNGEGKSKNRKKLVNSIKKKTKLYLISEKTRGVKTIDKQIDRLIRDC
jgi:hypothetical protein